MAATTTAGWVHVPPAMLRGEGLAPYPAVEFSALFDWSERDDAGSVHVMPYAGQFLIDVVEIEDNAVHQPSKPADEIVCVLNGALSLVTDGFDGEQVYRRGESVLIPAGWSGIYRVVSENGPFRELCIIPHDYFDPAIVAYGNVVVTRADTVPKQSLRHRQHLTDGVSGERSECIS